MRIAETAVVPEADIAKWETRRMQDRRLERIRPYASAVTSADVRRIVDDRLDTPAWRLVERFLVRWDEDAMSFLWLCGAMGRGKTVASLGAIAQEGGRMVSAQEVSRAFGQETEEARALRRSMLETRLLVVDDGGTELNGTKAKHGMQELMNKRQNRMATLITTNLSRDVVVGKGQQPKAMRYDVRTIQRVLHQGAIVEVKGPDLRAKS